MDYEDLRKELIDSAREMSDNPEGQRDAFVAEIASTAVEFGLCTGFNPCRFDGTERNNRRISIDGYCYDEDDDTLSIFVADYDGGEASEHLTGTDFDKLVKRARYFVEGCFSGSVFDLLEDGTPELYAAKEISDRHDDIRRIRFFPVSDKARGDRTINVRQDDIEGIPTQVRLLDIASYSDLVLSKPERERPSIDFENYGSMGIPCLKAQDIAESDYEAYLCVMPATLLSAIYKDFGASLLESNVRSFLSLKRAVNRGMRKTLANEPGRFFAYNNGISATAQSAVLSENGETIKKIVDLQIVNGGQTTAVINKYEDTDGSEGLKSVFIPMKLCVIGADAPGDLVPKISEYSNSQNKVTAADFTSNAPFNIKLEGISRRELAPPVAGSVQTTHWYYERANGSYMQDQALLSPSGRKNFLKNNPKSQMMTKADFAKYRNTYELRPHIVSRGTQKSIAAFMEKANTLWSERTPNGAMGAKFNDAYFRDTVSIAIIYRDLEKSISNKELSPWYNGGYRGNIVPYSIAKLISDLEGKGAALDLKRIWNEQSVTPELRSQLLAIAEKVLSKITEEGRPKDDVREWCKDPRCWETIRAMPVELNDPRAYAVSERSQKYETKVANRSERDRLKMEANIEVVNLGTEYWKRLYEWGVERGLLDKSERNLINTVINTIEYKHKPPSLQQSIRLLKIRDGIVDDGFQ